MEVGPRDVDAGAFVLKGRIDGTKQVIKLDEVTAERAHPSACGKSELGARAGMPGGNVEADRFLGVCLRAGIKGEHDLQLLPFMRPADAHLESDALDRDSVAACETAIAQLRRALRDLKEPDPAP